MIKRALAALSTPFVTSPPTQVEHTPTGARIVCDDAVNMIVSFERLHRVGGDGLVYPYWDMLGYPTIGIGHLLSRVKFEDLSKYSPITQDAAHTLHRRDLDKFSIGVSNLLKCVVTDNQFGALVCLGFNIGLGNLQASTLLRKLNRGDSISECGDEFLKWNKGGGKVIAGLTRRREAERKLFLS